MGFDKWALLKVFEVGFAIACLVAKRVTDSEATRLFLYLQKLSREWSLLNNVTWDKVGAAVADATYGGYVLITLGLLFGKIAGEIPTSRRVLETFLLGIGALLYIILGSLEFAALDSVPPDLVDNAAVLGSLSLITAVLFLIDLGGPRAKKTSSKPLKIEVASKPLSVSPNEQDPESLQNKEIKMLEEFSKQAKTDKNKTKRDLNGFDFKVSNPGEFRPTQNGYKKIKEGRESGRKFDIYGKDVPNQDVPNGAKDNENGDFDKHSPVWSQIRKGNYGKYDIVLPPHLYMQNDSPDGSRTQPSSPSDPGYVQYTAKRWGQQSQKTPRHSPTQV
ncbi:hypothetical protein RN001_013073 [Aquatica leii]|uniref:Uncharacterized protein n=1 Tax=Aquatica leii TaxID=1421715 RepID=A0AAN7P278_9COLE|nr:hypothetical protein RN001_013073 [Aquatica leii]